MNKLFKILIVLFFVMIGLNGALDAKNKKAPAWKYDIECAGNGADGTYLVRVWSYGKDRNVATNLVKQNAVHGVLFRGYGAGEQGCKGQKAIIKSPGIYEEKADYFDPFFGDEGKEGDYSKYVSIVSPTPEIIKVNKKEYKVGYVLSVTKDQLRKDLEAAGIIKGLSSGF